MPQFELDLSQPPLTGLFRGRTVEEAVQRAANLPPETPLAVAPEEDVHGWRDVQIGNAPAGRVRAHQRMRFRRD
jgi:hypothetical protein